MYDSTRNSSRIPPKITLDFYPEILLVFLWECLWYSSKNDLRCFRKSFWNSSRNFTEIFTPISLKYSWDSNKNPVGVFFRISFYSKFFNKFWWDCAVKPAKIHPKIRLSFFRISFKNSTGSFREIQP